MRHFRRSTKIALAAALVLGCARDGRDIETPTTPVAPPTPPTIPTPPPPPPTPGPRGPLLAYSTCVSWTLNESFVDDCTRSGLIVRRADGTEQTIATRAAAALIDIAWSPDGTRFAYSALSCDYAAVDCLSEIRVMSADGTNDVRIMSGANGYRGGHAMAWSPDGQRIAFHAWNERLGPHTAALFVMNADGSNLARLGEFRAMYPAWSPDGKHIAYSAFEANDRWSIAVANADGSNPVALTTPVGSTDGRSDSEPNWSPDGQHIAFGRSWPVASQNGRCQIFVMNADGSSVQQHTKDYVCARSPSWSTDGAGIAYTASSAPGILFVNADGSGTKILRQMIPGGRVTWGPAHE